MSQVEETQNTESVANSPVPPASPTPGRSLSKLFSAEFMIYNGLKTDLMQITKAHCEAKGQELKAEKIKVADLSLELQVQYLAAQQQALNALNKAQSRALQEIMTYLMAQPAVSSSNTET